MRTALILATSLLIFSGCGVEAEDHKSILQLNGVTIDLGDRNLFDVSELVEQELSIDLTVPNSAYYAPNGLDTSGVELICPNGQVMGFDDWVELRSDELGVSFFELPDGFIITASTTGDGTNIEKGCPSGCSPCTDGGCICGGTDPQ